MEQIRLQKTISSNSNMSVPSMFHISGTGRLEEYCLVSLHDGIRAPIHSIQYADQLAVPLCLKTTSSCAMYIKPPLNQLM